MTKDSLFVPTVSSRPSPWRAWAASATLILASWLSLPGGGNVLAQESSVSAEAEPPGYRPLIDDGLREFEIEHYEEARALFMRAHKLFPNARTQRALGLVAFELRNYVEAVQYLDQAISSGARPLEGALRESTSEVLNRALGFVGRIRLIGPSEHVTMRVDGRPAERTTGELVLLRIGEHVLEATAPNFPHET